RKCLIFQCFFGVWRVHYGGRRWWPVQLRPGHSRAIAGPHEEAGMAKIKLTDDYIRTRARPDKGNVIDYDTDTKGLAVRFTPTGVPSFLYCYGSGLAGGSARRMVLGPWTPASGRSLASVLPAMRKEAIRLAGIVAEGRDP